MKERCRMCRKLRQETLSVSPIAKLSVEVNAVAFRKRVVGRHHHRVNFRVEKVEQNTKDFLASLPPAPEVSGEGILPPSKDPNLKTLVLDLDETLIKRSLEPLKGGHDFEITTSVLGQKSSIFVKERPFLREFLQNIKGHFEIVIFTAGARSAADPVISQLDPDWTLFDHRLYKDVGYFKDDKVIKNLKILGRDLDKVIIVDDVAESFAFQPNHGIRIRRWDGDPDDQELLMISQVLTEFSQSKLPTQDFIRSKNLNCWD